MKIFVKAYTAFNLGDDLFLKILFERYPNVKFLLEENQCTFIFRNNYSNVKTFKIPILLRILYKIIRIFKNKYLTKIYIETERIRYNMLANKIDAFIFIGGSIFMQNKPILNLSDKINKVIIDCFNRKPIFVIGANFGPFIENEFVEYYWNLFNKCDDVCFRDNYSKNLFSNLSNVRSFPDVVFQLRINPQINKNRIGFSIIDMSTRENFKLYETSYLLKINQLIQVYFEKGFDIYLFSFCSSEGDESAIKNLLLLLPINCKEAINLIFYDGDIDKFLKIYLTIDTMFTTRFHAMILSLMGGQKICPLVYSNKMINVINDIPIDIKYYKIEEFINEKAMKIISSIKSYEMPLGELSFKAEKQFEKLDIILL